MTMWKSVVKPGAVTRRSLTTRFSSKTPFVEHTSADIHNEARPFDALQQNQLEFCCITCGYEAPCQTCPFEWFGFDAKKARFRFTSMLHGEQAKEVKYARGLLGLSGEGSIVGKRELKAAFRKQALEWHPDCNSSEEAEQRFKQILEAYQLLLALAL